MLEFMTKIIGQLRETFSKLDTAKKVIVGVVAGVAVISFVVLFSVSGSAPNVVLFSELSQEDFGQVTKKMDELGLKYESKGGRIILVKPTDRDAALTRLAQENMIPKGIPGWKLFDLTKWTETDKELDVKYMRALRDEIKRHIESLKNISKADVEIAMSEDSLFTDGHSPYTAAVTVHLAAGFEKLSKKEVKGIVYLVSRAVGSRLKPENVTVTDDSGNIISDFESADDKIKEEYNLVEYRKKFEEKARVRMLKDIREGLEKIFSADRIQIVRLNMDFNWDKIQEEQEEYTPIVIEPQDPTKPYNTRKVKDSLVVSEKATNEKFQGHGWNPEGPAGTEGNRPPGYKGSDDQFSKYEKNENIRNHALNKTKRKIERDPFDITRVSVSLAIDGYQDLPRTADGDYDLDPTKVPVQLPVKPEELKKAENIVKKAINFSDVRGDQVAVENIMFDRSTHWNSIRDEYRRKEQMKKLVFAALVGVVALFVGFILFKTISRELERRRRIREEQLALEQQRMREAALRAAEDEGIDVELSLEEKARLELHQTAISLAKERPDDVAQLLRTWLAEE